MVDVGVTDAPFGGGLDRQLLRGALPVARAGSPRSAYTGLDRFAAAFPAVTAVQADGRDLPFADGAFDLGFSNAVVEHVAGGRDGQRRFVHELCRVARRVFVTTPNRFFPLEVHTLVPFAHWLPRGPRDRVLRARGFDDVLEPLGPSELASLFPYSVRVVNTRHDADRRRPRMSLRRPVWALYVLIVGLALHNLVMSQLWRAGVRGGALSAIAAWKDVLLLVALGLVVWRRRGLPFDRSYVVDWLALAFGAFVVVYARAAAVAGSAAARRTRACSTRARHDLLPVEAYFLGRGLELTSRGARGALCRVVLATAACVAAFGLVDVYLVPLSWWRHSAGVVQGPARPAATRG